MTEPEGEGGTPEPQDDNTIPEPADDLAALREALAKERKTAREGTKAARERDQLRAKLAEFEQANATEAEKAVAKAREEADRTARAEEAGKWQKRIVRAEVVAAAGGKLADPHDAARLLDLDQFELDDNGDLDPKAVGKAIDDLLKAKPYLAAAAKAPSFDGGARQTAPAGTDMNALIRRQAGVTT